MDTSRLEMVVTLKFLEMERLKFGTTIVDRCFVYQRYKGKLVEHYSDL